MEKALSRARVDVYLFPHPFRIPYRRTFAGVSLTLLAVTDTRYVGFLATHEGYVMGLDTLPLFLGIMVYTVFWPPAILTPETRVSRTPAEEVQYPMSNTDSSRDGSNVVDMKAEAQ